MKTRYSLIQRGFTLIELIITIVIIGVLAAVAIPKFQSLTNDAEKGVASGVGAALASATSVNYGRSKLPNPVDCGTNAIGTQVPTGTGPACTYYKIATCTALAGVATLLADIPTDYVVDTTGNLNTDGTVANCTIKKGSIAGPVLGTFGAYGTL